MTNVPQVYLVGSGPGNPDLLTVKAHRLLMEAKVVVYDRLVSEEILNIIPDDTEIIYVGKVARRQCTSQEDINSLLLKLVNEGKQVVRLKGGDPFIFGRGIEEVLFLAEHGISFEVVPGISAAAGCGAALNIPFTHRNSATGVRFVTGHRKNNQELDLNWKSLADSDTTLVIYMGLSTIHTISGELIAAGLPADTPAIAVENATTPKQRYCISTLAELPIRLNEMEFIVPTLIIIGRVVGFAKNFL